jgi:hypothetical protein
MSRSTVLSLPLQLVFPARGFFTETIETRMVAYPYKLRNTTCYTRVGLSHRDKLAESIVK